MQIFIGGFNVPVSESALYLFQADTAIQEQGCGCVPEAMEFTVPESVPFQELAELSCRCLGVHHFPIPLREQEARILPL